MGFHDFLTFHYTTVRVQCQKMPTAESGDEAVLVVANVMFGIVWPLSGPNDIPQQLEK